MIGALVILLGFAAAAVHLWVSKQERTKGRVMSVLLVYALVFQVGGLGLVLGFIPHLFFAEQTARSIGWAPGSPFQFEVGIHDGAWGVLGFLCIWFRGGFRVATGLGWALFMLGAAAGHVHQAVAHADLAEYNFFTIFTDAFVAIELPILLYLDRRWNKKDHGASGTFCWNELVSKDPAGSQEFYARLFGWSPAPYGDGKDYILFKHPNSDNPNKAVGGIFKMPAAPATHWLAYVIVEDCDDAVRKAGDLGGKIVVEPKDIPKVGRLAVLVDPQGAAIGVIRPQRD